MRSRHLILCVSLLALHFATLPARAASSASNRGGRGTGARTGVGVGATLPQGEFGDFNDPGYFLQSRSLYVEKIIGGRAAAYYGDTAGSNGAGGGRVYGFDFDVLAKVGSPDTFGYAFAGAGYGKLTFTSSGPTPGSSVRDSYYDWCWTGGIGFSFKRKHGFYLEASYVSYQTNPRADFVPVVVGFEF